MKKSRLLMSILTATIDTTALTACNGGGGANNRTVSAVKAKSISAAELEVLHERVKLIEFFNENPKILIPLIQDFNLLKYYPVSEELKAVHADIIEAFMAGDFGTEPVVLTALATSLGTMNITDPYIQHAVIRSIFWEGFGKDPVVLTALATSLGKMNITDSSVQGALLNTLRGGKFGKDPAVLTALTTSLNIMNITDPALQQDIAELILRGKLCNNFAELPDFAKHILSNTQITDNILDKLPGLRNYHFFGVARNNLASEVEPEQDETEVFFMNSIPHEYIKDM